MPLNKEAYLRYKILDACIGNKYNPFPSMDKLIAECEEKLGKSFSISTIQKDIKTMKEDEVLGFMAPIKFSKSHNGYYYSEENYSIRNIPLNEVDVSALMEVTELISLFGGNRVSDNFGAAVEKILASSKEVYTKSKEKRTIIQTEVAPKQRGSEHFDFFLKAAKDLTPVCFIHYNYQKRHFSSVVLHPYLLKEFQNRWYIIGYSENHKEIRTFGLDRVKDPLYLKKDFISKADFNPEKHFADIYGVYPLSKKREKVLFLVDDVLFEYLNSQPLHPSQNIVMHLEYGTRMAEFNLIVSQELANFFLMHKQHIKILTPHWLRDEIGINGKK